MFGPGSIAYGIHGPDEFVPIEDVIQCAKIFAFMAWIGVDIMIS